MSKKQTLRAVLGKHEDKHSARVPDTPMVGAGSLVVSHKGELREAITVRTFYAARGSGMQPVRACIWMRPTGQACCMARRVRLEPWGRGRAMNAVVNRYGTILRLYDNGGRSADRYTIVPPRWASAEYRGHGGLWDCLGCNSEPFHPKGIGMHSSCQPGPHLGRRIHWGQLPPEVQRAARQSFPEFCPNPITGKNHNAEGAL